MRVLIYGRPGCPFCTRAKELAQDLQKKHNDFEYRYIDIYAEGLTKDDLTKLVGKKVETVPQVFIDDKPIGGCTDFEALMKRQFA